jgi:bifunctional non-homologous end joining protein LigD
MERAARTAVSSTFHEEAGLASESAIAARPRPQRRSRKSTGLPAFRPVQLATLVDTVPTGRNWLFETKFDGYRCLAALAGKEVRLYTRAGNDWTRQFADVVPALSGLTAGTALIDGEICALKDGRTDFSALKDALSTGAPLVYFVFDLLEENGEDLADLPQIERKTRLEALLGTRDRSDPVQYSDHIRGRGEEVFAEMCRRGLEGVIAKQADAPYRGERTKAWLKVKCLHRQEFVIGGWRPSDKRNRFASLLLGAWENGKLIYHGRVGTGFNERSGGEVQEALDARPRQDSPFAEVPRDIGRKANWVEPDLVAEIAFTEFTPDGALRHPSFLGLRNDKAAKSVVVEKPASLPDAAPAAAPRPSRTEPTGTKAPGAGEPPQADLSEAAGTAAAERAGVRLTSPDRVEYPGQGVTKGMLAAYYAAVAKRMLPYIADRPLSLVRCPQGRAKYCFFQKHDSGGFPDAFKTVEIAEKDGKLEDYFYINDLAGLIAGVQMNVLEFHLWGAKRDDVERPERLIFDIDPDPGVDFPAVRQAALDIRRALGRLGLETFPMVTGGKGIHVIAPVRPAAEWPAVKAFCKSFAQRLEAEEPDRFVANMSKAKRKGRMFIDYLRNERGSTAIAPWSTRSREGAPVAFPLSWDELAETPSANGFTIAKAAGRATETDPWQGYFTLDQAVTDKLQAAVGSA